MTKEIANDDIMIKTLESEKSGIVLLIHVNIPSSGSNTKWHMGTDHHLQREQIGTCNYLQRDMSTANHLQKQRALTITCRDKWD